jgi:hypothetical protein
MTLLLLGGGALGARLAAALSAAAVPAHQGPAATDDAASLAAAVAASRSAPAAIVILVSADAPDAADQPFATLDEAGWHAGFERPLRQARVRLQAAEALLPSGGRAILVASTGGMAGVPGAVAACALEEGARALAKSVALAWKASDRSLCFAAFDRESLQTETGLAGNVAPTLRLLLSAPPSLTGSTVIADGGTLLAP